MSANSPTLRSVFAARMKAARLAVGLSQKALGELIGLDPFTASTRINRYERGVHEPDLQTLARIAAVLNLPAASLVAEDDRLAHAVIAFSRLSRREQDKVLRSLDA